MYQYCLTRDVGKGRFLDGCERNYILMYLAQSKLQFDIGILQELYSMLK